MLSQPTCHLMFGTADNKCSFHFHKSRFKYKGLPARRGMVGAVGTQHDLPISSSPAGILVNTVLQCYAEEVDTDEILLFMGSHESISRWHPVRWWCSANESLVSDIVAGPFCSQSSPSLLSSYQRKWSTFQAVAAKKNLICTVPSKAFVAATSSMEEIRSSVGKRTYYWRIKLCKAALTALKKTEKKRTSKLQYYY